MKTLAKKLARLTRFADKVNRETKRHNRKLQLRIADASRNGKSAKKKKACVVCGCTEDAACLVTCAWDRRWPDVCSGCAGPTPYTVVGIVIAGPGKYPAASFPFGETTFDDKLSKEIAAALNQAYALGQRFGVRKAWSAKP